MSSLTILLAPRGPAAGVLGVLRDWSALGLVDRFVWVEADTVVDRRVPALEIRGGRPQAANLDSLLATGNTRFDLLRVCVLVPMLGSAPVVPSDIEQRVVSVVGAASGGRPVTQLRLLLVRPGSAEQPGIPAQMGWHNLVLAPEDAEGPGRPSIGLPTDDDAVDIGLHAAAAVAGVAGLWSGADQSPFDTMMVLPGENLRLVRSYYRRLQTGALESDLRARVTATSRGMPLPVLNGASAAYIEDVELATSTMAKTLWARHAGVLQGPRVQLQQQQDKPVGFGQVLKMFFSFLLSAIKNAPGAWYRGVVNKVSSTAAKKVHSAVFGAVPTAYRTVVNGRTDTGVPVSWLEIGVATGQVAQALSGPGEDAVHQARPDLTGLWQESTAGALTLADAGARVDGLEYAQIGTTRGVMRSPLDIAPDETANFGVNSGAVMAAIGNIRLPVRDVLSAEDLANRLRHASQDPNQALDAGRAHDALQAWRGQHRRSYVVQVGNYLGHAVTKLGQEIGGILDRLSQAAGSNEAEQAERTGQRKLARVQRFLLIGLVVGLAVLGILLGFGVIVGAVFAIIAVVLVIAWAVTAVVTFIKGQKALFAEMHRRRQVISQAEADNANLREALRDFRRVTDAYHQYLAWSEVLGAVLSAPFGQVPRSTDDISRLNSGLPLSARVGVAEIDEGAASEAAVMVRQDLFRYGWPRDPWETTLSGAAQLLGPEAHALRSNPNLLYGQQAFAADSQLRNWAERLARTGPGEESGDQLWVTVINYLQNQRTDLLWPLLGRVSVPGSPGWVTLSEFMTGVDRAQPSPVAEHFDGSILTAQSRTAGHTAAVSPNVAFTHAEGLGRVAVLTQMTDGLPTYEFDLAPAVAESGIDDVELPEPAGQQSDAFSRRPEDEPEAPIAIPNFPGMSF